MPDFAIELPGEANPLTEHTLLQTLQAASSSNPLQIQSATKQLQQWERAEGFYKHLQTVFIARELPVDVRYLAVIQLKNGIDKYWRKSATNAVSKEDKATIRSRLIQSGIEEQERRLAIQNALVIAKIARFEYPQDWPDAINSVLEAIRSCSQDSTSPRLERALLILLYIIKELSTARIQRSRTNLQAATPEITSVLGAIYVNKVQQWQQALQTDPQSDQLITVLSQSLLAIKIIRRLLISGYQSPHKDEDVTRFWELTFSHLHAFIEQQHANNLRPDAARLIQRHIMQTSKFHLEMAEKHPASFVFLPSAFQLVNTYWSVAKSFSETYSTSLSASDATTNGDDEGLSIPEKLSLNGLLLIRACIRMAFKPTTTFVYRHKDEKEERKEAAARIKQELLTQSFVEDVMTVIMTKFLVLRQADLADWANDAEDFVLRQESESEDMNLSVRACSERLVLDLSTHFKASLTEPILSLFSSITDVNNEDVDILFKDAVYAAIGMAAAIFREDIDFDSVLVNTLVAEAQKQEDGANILRRRIAIFVGQWVLVKISPASRPVVYQLFDHLLDTNDETNDLVVCATAGHQFKNVVDDYEFDAQQFAPHAQSIITKLMTLIQGVESTATKLGLLDTISALIERFDFRIEPFADAIVSMLPALWEQSEEEHMMKQSILTVLSRLVRALKESSGRFHAMLIPIISNAVQSDSEMQIYLLEEALDLWRSILVQTPSPISPELLTLVDHLFPFFDLASESLRAALEIVESYIVLAPQEMLSDAIRKPLLARFTPLTGPKVRAESCGMVCVCVELMLRSASSLGGEAALKQIVSDLVDTDFLPRQLGGLRSAWVAHCTTGPLAKMPAVDGVVETDFLAILARILLDSPDTFLQVLTYTTVPTIEGESAPPPPADTLPWLLEEWFSHLDNIGDPERRKLMALALSKLLSTGHPTMLSQLQLLMSLWTSVVTELCEPEANRPDEPIGRRDNDCLVYADPIGLRVVEEGAPEEPEDQRRRMLSWHDPVHRVGLPWVIRQTLAETIQRVGGEAAFREHLDNVDKDVIAAFGALGIMN